MGCPHTLRLSHSGARRGEAKLAARLTFTPGGAAGRLNTMARSPPMALLAYMRLVRAGAVRATRRQSGSWLRTREDWRMGQPLTRDPL